MRVLPFFVIWESVSKSYYFGVIIVILNALRIGLLKQNVREKIVVMDYKTNVLTPYFYLQFNEIKNFAVCCNHAVCTSIEGTNSNFRFNYRLT